MYKVVKKSLTHVALGARRCHWKQWFWKRGVSISCVDREAAANHVLQTLRKKIWLFNSPLQQWLRGQEYSMHDLQCLSLKNTTYNSWAWLQNNWQIGPNKNLRQMRWELFLTTRHLRRVLFSHQWRQVPPLMSICVCSGFPMIFTWILCDVPMLFIWFHMIFMTLA